MGAAGCHFHKALAVLRHGGTSYYPSSASDDQTKLSETWRHVISDGRFTSPSALQQLF